MAGMVVPRISKGKDKAKRGFEKLTGMGQRQLWPHQPVFLAGFLLLDFFPSCYVGWIT